MQQSSEPCRIPFRHFKVDDMAKVGATLVDIDVPDSASAEESGEQRTPGARCNEYKPAMFSLESSAAHSPARDQSTGHTAPQGGARRLLATPAVRRLIKENKVDLERISGTGKEGRVLKEDVLRHIGVLEDRPAAPFAGSARTTTASPAVMVPRVEACL